jgi:hypothetical protein
MSIKRISIIMAVIAVFVFSLQSFYKVATVPKDNTIEITGPVSFSGDLIPLFNASCNMSGCHAKGGQKPDLTPDNAYTSLTNGGYIDVTNPENSSVYLWLTGKKGTPMPPGGPSNPSGINDYMLAWIQQGALNN